jgi:hypothetical protein
VLRRHYTTLSRLRILLSSREAGAYVVIEPGCRGIVRADHRPPCHQ